MIPPAAAPPIRKRFGQHFLRDAAVIDAMIEAVSPRAGDVVVEIGPGDGALTFPLLAAGARVIAVEIDRARADVLRRREEENLRVVEGDILRVDWRGLVDATGAARWVGNLPYNISGPLLSRFFAARALVVDAHLTLQKEVAARLTAAPGGADYGRLSIGAQLAFAIEPVLPIPARAFTPPPKVESTFLRLRPRADVAPPRLLDAVLRAAFAARRKTLANALAAILPPAAAARAPIDLSRRAQTLRPSEFCALAHWIENDSDTMRA